MLMLAVALSLLPAQLRAPAAEDALMEPMLMRVPSPGETDVARNAAFITVEQLTGVAVITFEGSTEVETAATLETVEGVTIARLPVQPALSNVTVRLSFPGGFTEDTSWTTGNALIEAPAAAPEVVRAEAVRPFLENPHVEIELAPNDTHAAAVLMAVDGEQRSRITTIVSFGVGSGMFLGDYSYQGGTQDYEVLVIDRGGNVAEAVPVTVSTVGCASTPVAPAAALALVLLARRRRRAPRV